MAVMGSSDRLEMWWLPISQILEDELGVNVYAHRAWGTVRDDGWRCWPRSENQGIEFTEHASGDEDRMKQAATTWASTYGGRGAEVRATATDLDPVCKK